MTTYTVDAENTITAFGSAEEAAAASATPFDSFANPKQLAELIADWPAERSVAIWNNLPGVAPGEDGFKNAKTAASRIWKRIQGLGAASKPELGRAPRSRKRNARQKLAHRPPRARPPRPRQPRRPPSPRTRPRPKRPRKPKKPGRARVARPLR